MTLRVIAQLPDKHIYKQVNRTENYAYVYEDKATHLIRICSNFSDIWDKDLEVRIKIQWGKTEKGKYPLRLDLQVFPVERELERCQIIREDYLGKFAFTTRNNTRNEILGFYCFQSVSVNAINPRWIAYSVVLEK